MASFFFAQPVDVEIRLEGEEARKTVEVKLEKDRKETQPIYYDGEPITGQVWKFLQALLDRTYGAK